MLFAPIRTGSAVLVICSHILGTFNARYFYSLCLSWQMYLLSHNKRLLKTIAYFLFLQRMVSNLSTYDEMNNSHVRTMQAIL